MKYNRTQLEDLQGRCSDTYIFRYMNDLNIISPETIAQAKKADGSAMTELNDLPYDADGLVECDMMNLDAEQFERNIFGCLPEGFRTVMYDPEDSILLLMLPKE